VEPDIAMPTEVEKFVERMTEKGVIHMHVDWGDDAANATAEQRAKALNDVDDWLAVPGNGIASRLRGRAFLLQDSAHCTRTKFNVAKMEYVAMSRAEEVKASDMERFAALLIEAADYIEDSVKRDAANAQ